MTAVIEVDDGSDAVNDELDTLDQKLDAIDDKLDTRDDKLVARVRKLVACDQCHDALDGELERVRRKASSNVTKSWDAVDNRRDRAD